MGKSYNRYNLYKSNGEIQLVPFVPIPQLSSDLYVYYDKSSTRLDVLSYLYYNDPNYGWLILQANPEYGSLEFNIPDGVKLRIPYPIDMVLIKYEEAINQYKEINGEN